jgi:YfiH family protein
VRPAIEVIPVAAMPSGVRGGFTTRAGGVSRGTFASLNLGATSGDEGDAVRTNRDALAEVCGFDAPRAVTLVQVHGVDVIEVGVAGGGGRFTGSLAGIADADGCVTSARGVALLAQGADCVPVLLWNAEGSRAAAIHAGWRGLVAGVLGNAVAAMGQGQIAAAIGPCIGPCCYPVDEALRASMAHRFGGEVVVGDAVDLRAAARRALGAAGVDDSDIADVPGCTSCDHERFFSYRRDGARTGRQAGVIWLVEE